MSSPESLAASAGVRACAPVSGWKRARGVAANRFLLRQRALGSELHGSNPQPPPAIAPAPRRRRSSKSVTARRAVAVAINSCRHTKPTHLAIHLENHFIFNFNFPFTTPHSLSFLENRAHEHLPRKGKKLAQLVAKQDRSAGVFLFASIAALRVIPLRQHSCSTSHSSSPA